MSTATRYRTRGAQAPTTMSYTFKETTPGSSPVTGSGTLQAGNYAGFYGYVSDVVTKSKFMKVADFRKWKQPQPFSAGALTVTPSVSSHTTTYVPFPDGKIGERTWIGDGLSYLFGPLVPVPGTLTFGSYPALVNGGRLRDLAVIGCLNRINPASNQSWIILHEATKTSDMIFDRARKLANAYLAFKRGDIRALDRLFPGKRTFTRPKKIVLWDEHGQPIVRKNGKMVARYARKPLTEREFSNLSSAARLELEFRYGWTPLVHDIVDSLKAINAALLRKELAPHDYTKVYEKKAGSRTVSNAVTVSRDGGTFVGIVTSTHKEEVHAYAKYFVAVPDSLANRLNDFGIFDIPRSLWDGVPLSFVFDWFIPVGEWLGAMSPKVGVEVIESGVVQVTSREVVRTLTGYTPASTTAGSWLQSPWPIGSQDSFSAIDKSRTLGLPVPLLPPPEVKINFKRLADAAALLRVMR